MQAWIWNGTAWNFAPGSSSGYVLVVFPGITALPPGLWTPCNGSMEDVTQNNGSLLLVTTPVVVNGYLRQ